MSDGSPPRRALRDLGEFGFIDSVRRRFGGPVRPGELGIGDDAAVIPAGRGRIVLTADMLLEGVHFDLRYFRPGEIGWRALMANLSDLAAMGAEPVCYLVSIAAKSDTSLDLLHGVFAGMASAARSSGIRLLGGDTCRGDRLVLSLALAGRIGRGREVRRSGARPGDLLFVTGEPGWSRLGLRLLSGGRPPRLRGWKRRAAEAHLKPVARLAAGRAAARSGAVSAMIDLSDGLLPDLTRLLAESRCGARLEEPFFPISPRFRAAARALGENPLAAFLAGGEDYELLMAVPPRRVSVFRRAANGFGVPAVAIGEVTRRRGVRIHRPDGSVLEGDDLPEGFSHFPAAASRRPGSFPLRRRSRSVR
ncbi:MAG: thiamine-phosphate kinase [Deltaproteobacteria bacterium]